MPDSEEVIAQVLLDQGIDKPLDYGIPESLQGECKPGMRVLVPVRGKEKKGTVFALAKTSLVANVQNISKLLSETPLLPPSLLQLAEWMAKYYCTPLPKVMQGMLPAPVRNAVKKKSPLFVTPLVSRPELLALCEELRMKSPEQAKVLDVLLLQPKGMLLSELLEKADVSSSPYKSLVNKGILHAAPVDVGASPIDLQEVFATKPKILRAEQEEALEKIVQSQKAQESTTHLLYGVTGSGKTEVYLQAMAHALALGKGVIFLVPEILLAAQTLERIRTRFPEKVALFHHRLSDGERYSCWQEIHAGKIRIVVGARSALFAPVKNLGLIILDEEHESAYKQQEEQPCYHARDVACVRAKLEQAVLVLGSATPSLESFYRATFNKFSLSRLLTRNETHVTIIDMKKEFTKARGFTLFSEPLIEGIKKRKTLGEQTILLLNRRGYHTSCLCKTCAHVAKCPHCDLSLTYHLNEKILSCHLCDFRTPSWRICPKCHSQDTLKYKGAGTELVERSLHAIISDLRTLRLDADTTRHKGSHEQIFRLFRAGKADVLIGTQMVAKGLHLPSVTLVGVLNADSSLGIPDFRAQEKTFQLITQVAGRAGRAEFAGAVIIQTHMPEHGTIQRAAQEQFESFFHEELENRKAFGFPPFLHLAKVVFSAEDAHDAKNIAERFRHALIQELPPAFHILPVIPCGHPKAYGKFRFQFLIKGTQRALLSHKLQHVAQAIKSSKVRTLIDIDPETTFF